MKKNILTCLWAVLIGLVVIVLSAAIASRTTKNDIKIETEAALVVEAAVQGEEHEETTTATDTTEPVSTVAVEETTTEIPSYTTEELARYVLDYGINGPEREAYLGDRYWEVQEWINQNHVPPKNESTYVGSTAEEVYYPAQGGGDILTPSAGVNYFGGIMETYYCLDMTGVVQIMRSMGYDEANYPYWVRGDGVKMLGGFVMVAADFGQFPRGSVVQTSLGTGLVCDTGSGGWNWFDIAVTW